MKKYLIIFVSLFLFIQAGISQDTLSKKEIRKQSKSYLIPGRPWTFEIPLWIPGFGGSFAYGDVSIEGEDGVGIENPIEPPPPFDWGKVFSRVFTSKWYLKFFFITRVAYEKNRFLGQIDGIAGAVGESVQFNYNSQEVVQANFRTINVRLFFGYKFINAVGRNKKFRYELFGYLGARAHFHKISSDLNNAINKLDINPAWIEPIIGLQNQFSWKRWYIVVQGDYGGFLIDSKYSIQLTTFVYYRSGSLTSLKLGWNHLDLNHRGTFLKEDYKVNVTLSGPSLGLVFHF